jgi:hypothetical protein
MVAANGHSLRSNPKAVSATAPKLVSSQRNLVGNGKYMPTTGKLK